MTEPQQNTRRQQELKNVMAYGCRNWQEDWAKQLGIRTDEALITPVTIGAKDSKEAKNKLMVIMENKDITLEYAVIRYNCKEKSTKIRNTRIYPLELSCELQGDIINIRVPCFTVGNSEESSRDLVDVLKFLGMEFDENDILTEQKMCEKSGCICLIYSKA